MLIKLVVIPFVIFSSYVTATEYRLMVHSPGMQAKQTEAQGESCLNLKKKTPSLSSGVYSIKNNGQQYHVYCDMVSEGGGWTMVVAQFEQDPVTNWNEGIQPDYDPSLATKKGFALNSEQLPIHNEVGFGKDLLPTNMDYFDFNYVTNDISKTVIKGKKTGLDFHIHRNNSHHHSGNNPDEFIYNNMSYPEWVQTLTVDRIGGRYHSWAFSPLVSVEQNRGYAFNGLNLTNSKDSFAWTVWVR